MNPTLISDVPPVVFVPPHHRTEGAAAVHVWARELGVRPEGLHNPFTPRSADASPARIEGRTHPFRHARAGPTRRLCRASPSIHPDEASGHSGRTGCMPTKRRGTQGERGVCRRSVGALRANGVYADEASGHSGRTGCIPTKRRRTHGERGVWRRPNSYTNLDRGGEHIHPHGVADRDLVRQKLVDAQYRPGNPCPAETLSRPTRRPGSRSAAGPHRVQDAVPGRPPE